MILGRNARVCVIGAGPSGLTAAKNLLQAGISNVTVYEKGSALGGNWRFSDEAGQSSVFETTFLISSKTLSQFEDFPMPDGYPDYPSHEQVLRYFETYAEHFGVMDRIRFNCGVEHAEPVAGDRWNVTLSDGSQETFDYLIVANGHHWQPKRPSYPGTFDGQIIHSHDYKRAAPFAGRRVLVVGGGNSGCDIAVEVSRVAQKTDISLRRGYYIWPKFLFGRPTDVVGSLNAVLPDSIGVLVQRLLNYVFVGSYSRYGLRQPKHGPTQQHPIVNSELLYFIRHGRIHPRPDIERFEGAKVRFVDGASEEYDTVVACTGFTISHPFLDKSVADYSQGDVPLYLRIFDPAHPTLSFIGLIQPQGCIWTLSDWQSRLVAHYIAGTYKLPADVNKRVRDDVQRIRSSYFAASRHTIEVNYFRHLQELKRALPKSASSKPVAASPLP